jgi:hypothetical protein
MRYRVLWVDTGTEGLADGAALRAGDPAAQPPLEVVVCCVGSAPAAADGAPPLLCEEGRRAEWGDGASGGVWASALCPRGAAAYFEAEVMQRAGGGALLLGVAGGQWCGSVDGGREGGDGAAQGCAAHAALLLQGQMDCASDGVPAAVEAAAAAGQCWGWREGQTVGVAVDLRAGRATVRVSADGDWAAAAAVPLELPAEVSGVRPAACFGGGGRAAVRMNLGIDRFRHGPPDADHAPFSMTLWMVRTHASILICPAACYQLSRSHSLSLCFD